MLLFYINIHSNKTVLIKELKTKTHLGQGFNKGFQFQSATVGQLEVLVDTQLYVTILRISHDNSQIGSYEGKMRKRVAS